VLLDEFTLVEVRSKQYKRWVKEIIFQKYNVFGVKIEWKVSIGTNTTLAYLSRTSVTRKTFYGIYNCACVINFLQL